MNDPDYEQESRSSAKALGGAVLIWVVMAVTIGAWIVLV